MKGVSGILLVVAAAGVAGFVGHKMASSDGNEALRKAENEARIQKDYLERVAWIRSNPDERAYRDEVGTFFRWYFKEVNDHHNRYGGNRNFDGYLAELDSRSERLTETQLNERKAFYEHVKGFFDAFRQGTYEPVYSGTSHGLRLDVVSADRKMVGGEPKIHLPIVLWGAQREMREDGSKMKRMVTSASFTMNWNLYDAAGKLIGEITATGDPSRRVDHPERFIPEFPSQLLLGEYEMDLLPAEVARVEMQFAVSSRSASGGEARATWSWKLDAPAEWKLRAGEAWRGAEESVRPLEDIDPAAAARAR
jgi:hypothetical protein